MNERIQQIADEAKRYALETYPSPYEPYANLYDKKFAELLIRECLTFIEPMPGSGDIDDIALQGVYNQIKEHFAIDKYDF